MTDQMSGGRGTSNKNKKNGRSGRNRSSSFLAVILVTGTLAPFAFVAGEEAGTAGTIAGMPVATAVAVGVGGLVALAALVNAADDKSPIPAPVPEPTPTPTTTTAPYRTPGSPARIIVRSPQTRACGTLTDGVNRSSKHSSLTEFQFNPKRHALVSYNHVPHLDHPDRADWLTTGRGAGV